MDLNAALIDQRLTKLVDELRERAAVELGIEDDTRLRSLAFVWLCVKELLDLEPDPCFDTLTEGGGDFGVDAIHLSEVRDGEFGVTLFQSKYEHKLEGDSNFPVNGLSDLIDAIRHLFDPSAELGAINARLRARVEEVRSLIGDGYLPRVRAICCNNGERWTSDGDAAIARSGFGDQVTWEHVNHEVLVRLLQRTARVDATLRMTGPAIFEDLNFSRVCVGRVPVTEIAQLMQTHGDRLLERNIRRYLGLHGTA